MSRLPAPLDGLLGLRLALYDEALAAGPLGIGRANLLARVAEEAQRMGLLPPAQLRDLEWLVANRLLEEIRPTFYRARRKEDAVSECGMRSAECGVPTQKAEGGKLKAEVEPKQPAAVAQLRTPVFAPRQRRNGQGIFF